MSLRRLLRILEGGLLALLAAAHLLFWFRYPAISAHWPSQANLLRDAALSAQTALVAGWLVAGPGRWWLRQPTAMLVGAAIVWFGLAAHPRGLHWGEMLLGLQAGTVGLGLVIFRAFGWRMTRAEPFEPRVTPRFSLRTLLVMTFAVALALRLGQWLRESVTENGLSAGAIVSITAVSFALPVVAAWPAVLSCGSTWPRTAALLLVTPAFGAITPYITAAPEELMPLVSWAGLQTLLVVVSLLALRAGGYRWVRVNERCPKHPAPASRSTVAAQRLRNEFLTAIKQMDESPAESLSKQGT